MGLNVPKLDDRTYREILNEALARIRVHNPEWTNWGESDPGVTLLELFAFMTESITYRANLIPERNRRKFLSLLGIPMQPAAAARGLITFLNETNPPAALTLSPDQEVRAGQVPFRTLSGLDVLPVEAAVYYKRPVSEERRAEVEELYAKLYSSVADAQELSYYETMPLEAPLDPTALPKLDLTAETVDGALWVALLARKPQLVESTRQAIANRVLTLGVLPAHVDDGRSLLPRRAVAGRASASLVFEVATDQVDATTKLPIYERLESRTSSDILADPGLVELKLPSADRLRLWSFTNPLEQGTGDYPPSLEDTRDEERIVTWIRLRLPQERAGNGMAARLSWVGVNASMITQRAHVEGELLGTGTGEPDQELTLINTPVIPGTVRITVGETAYTEIDDLLAAGPEVPLRDRKLPPGTPPPAPAPVHVFTVDRESGVVRFGDGARGARPPYGAAIRATYDFGGGRQGNVGIGAINKGPALPAGIKVTNPLPTWGGDEPETVEEAEREIPRHLKHQDRLVTVEDFEAAVRRTPGVDIGRVEVLPLYHPEFPELQIPGAVTVMAVPKYDVHRPDAPRPDRTFLDLICEHIDARRLVTTEIYVRGPVYKPVHVSVGVEVAPGREFAPVREAVNAAVRRFLSPLVGGREGTGWPLERAVLAKELWAEVARAPGVAYVHEVLLGDEQGNATEQIAMTGLELPWLRSVDTQQGEPEPLSQLTGRIELSDSELEAVKKRKPVPIIPDEC